jgi:hypothetical protein
MFAFVGSSRYTRKRHLSLIEHLNPLASNLHRHQQNYYGIGSMDKNGQNRTPLGIDRPPWRHLGGARDEEISARRSGPRLPARHRRECRQHRFHWGRLRRRRIALLHRPLAERNLRRPTLLGSGWPWVDEERRM